MINENKNEEQFKESNPSKKISRSVFEWLEEFVIAVSVIVLLLSFVVRIVTVSGSSMEPNYYHNDRLIITAHSGGIKEGDVIVVVDALNEPIIKRVVATEGQIVDLDQETGVVYVNGIARDESKYGIENGITFIHPNAVDPLEFPLTVPENHIFVLGDNRKVSNDSRYGEIGLIDERKVLGKAIFDIYPFDKIGLAK